MKYLSKIIKKLKKTYKGHVWKRPNHEPTDSYFYLAIHLARCMMIDDALNLDIEPVITEMTGNQYIPISHVCSNDDRKSKDFLEDKNLL